MQQTIRKLRKFKIQSQAKFIHIFYFDLINIENMNECLSVTILIVVLYFMYVHYQLYGNPDNQDNKPAPPKPAPAKGGKPQVKAPPAKAPPAKAPSVKLPAQKVVNKKKKELRGLNNKRKFFNHN